MGQVDRSGWPGNTPGTYILNTVNLAARHKNGECTDLVPPIRR